MKKRTKHSVETIERMSRVKRGKHLSPQTEFKKGYTPWNKGIKCNVGKDHPMYGRCHSEETKLKIRSARSKQKHPNWLGGISFEPYTSLFNQQLKDKIRVRDRFICQLCGIPELESSRRLDIHHIDYDKKNSNEDNLISLCQKCHLITNGRRSYWRNFFKRKLCLFS